ncbi:MAG TPA: hypothetical protein VIV57_20925 [Anaeromyxobacter sp.]
MRSAMLVLALASAAACGGGSGSPGARPGMEPGGGASGGPAAGPGGGSGAPGGASASLDLLDDAGDCAGLVPDRVPPPVLIRRSVPAGSACIGGTSDGTGAIAIGARDAAGATSWQAYAADGSARGLFAADAPLLPEPSGWQAIVASGPQGAEAPEVQVAAFAPDGAVARRETVSPDPARSVYVRWSLARDPSGGSLVALRSSALAGNHWSSVEAQRLDASGAPAWPGGADVRTVDSASEPLFLAGGVSVRGEALVLSQHSASLDVSWLDPRTGAPIPGSSAERAEPFSGVTGDGIAPAVELHPLLDGSIAVRSDGTFRRSYARLATLSSPLPAWLAERARFTFRFTRGGAGYAALPPAGEASADCAQRIELVSPSGRLCGRVVLREGGGACTTGTVDQGWDGTVVQQSGRNSCHYRWWPRLLAKE